MDLPDSMYDYRQEREPAKHICKHCDDPISEQDNFNYDGCCEYCYKNEELNYECEKCDSLITEVEYYVNNCMCNECNDNINN